MPAATTKPLAEAVASLDARSVLGSKMRTREWERTPAEIRQANFFSAAVEDVGFLDDAKTKLRQRLALERRNLGTGATMDRSRFIAEMGDIARGSGLGDGSRSLTDVGGAKRLGLIWDMQVQMAQGHAKHKMGLDPDVLAAVPAQEFRRVSARKKTRSDWPQRWLAAGGKVYEGRMIALKTDPVWVRLSRFGTPHPPFDFGSGMGVRSVNRSEAERLGIILPGQKPAAPAEVPPATAGLKTSARDLSEESRAKILETFGPAARIQGDEIFWDPPAARPDGSVPLPAPRPTAASMASAAGLRAGDRVVGPGGEDRIWGFKAVAGKLHVRLEALTKLDPAATVPVTHIRKL